MGKELCCDEFEAFERFLGYFPYKSQTNEGNNVFPGLGEAILFPINGLV
jgi:hypothetical protein